MVKSKDSRRKESLLSDEEVIKKYENLIRQIIRYYSWLKMEEDLYQECVIVLLKCRKTHDINRSSFITYAYRQMLNRCMLLQPKLASCIELTRRAWYEKGKRSFCTRLDITFESNNNKYEGDSCLDSYNVIPSEPTSTEEDINERLKIEDHNEHLKTKLYQSLKYIDNIGVKVRLVKFLNGKAKRISRRDISVIQEAINKNNRSSDNQKI